MRRSGLVAFAAEHQPVDRDSTGFRIRSSQFPENRLRGRRRRERRDNGDPSARHQYSDHCSQHPPSPFWRILPHQPWRPRGYGSRFRPPNRGLCTDPYLLRMFEVRNRRMKEESRGTPQARCRKCSARRGLREVSRSPGGSIDIRTVIREVTSCNHVRCAATTKD